MTSYSTEQLEVLRDAQLNNVQAADQIGVNEATVRRWRKKNRVVAAPQPPRGGGLVDAPEEGPSEIDLLRHERDELRKIVRKASRTDLGDERVLQAIERAIDRVEPHAPLWVPRARTSTSDAHHRHLAIWSDWHLGEHVEAESVNGLNAYSVPICEDRVAQLVDSILSFKAVRPAMTGLDIFVEGDMATGKIHDLEETNEIPAQEQYVAVGHLIAWAIAQLAPHYPEIRVFCTWGNHPRDKATPSTSHSNGDWVACQLAKAATGHLENVTWNIPKSGMVVANIAGLNFLVWHGDGIRSNSAGVPWMAMMKRVSLLRETFAEGGTQIDYVSVGHYHQPSAVPGLLMNGSLIGTNTHGMKNYGGGKKPCQLLLTLDERKSRITDVAYCTPS